MTLLISYLLSPPGLQVLSSFMKDVGLRDLKPKLDPRRPFNPRRAEEPNPVFVGFRV